MRKHHTGPGPLGYSAFPVAQVAPNEHPGQVISPSVVPASGAEAWTTASDTGVAVIRLTRRATGGPR